MTVLQRTLLTLKYKRKSLVRHVITPFMTTLCFLLKNCSTSIIGSASSVSAETDESAVFIRENSLSRYLIGPCHLNVASTTVHRVRKLLDCAYMYDYEPYSKKQTGKNCV